MLVAIIGLLAQLQSVVPHAGRITLTGWRFHAGDDSSWARGADANARYHFTLQPTGFTRAGSRAEAAPELV